ncbi:hypothetical protein AAEU28_09165 [Pseudoalteromonas sp. SS15]|uniref:hypothetical protein n=1 Tax=Pseudoalteromonas sp. SS15 TaxID=3139393 RepID=UPI003BAAEADD
MFNYSKVALGIAACFALSGCLEVEDNNNNNNNNNDALVQQLEQQNQILQNQLDYTKQKAEAWKTAITLVGSVELATEGDTLPSDLSVTFYYNGQWHDAVSLAADGSFEVSELPANTDFIAKVSSASNAIVKRHFFFKTPAKDDKFIQNLLPLTVGQPETIEFTVLDEKTNLPFKELHLEADLDASSYGFSTLKQIAGDNLSKATLNSETGMYELVAPKGFSLPLEQDRDLDNDGIDDVDKLEVYRTNDLSKNKLFYLDKVQAEEFKLVLNFINKDGETVKPEHVFATNNSFGQANFVYDEALKTHSIDANFYNSLRINIPAFSIEDTLYRSKTLYIGNYNDQTESYSVSGAVSNYGDKQIALEDNVLSVVVVLQENSEKDISLDLVTRSEVLNQEQAFTYFFNAPIAINEEAVVSIQQENVLVATPGNASKDDSIDPGTTYFEYKNVEVESSNSLSFNDTALTLKPNAKLEEGYNYRFNVEKVVNKKSGKLESINYSHNETIESSETFSEDAFVADNMNYRKAGKLIIATNSAGEVAGNYTSNEGSPCLLLNKKYNVFFESITPISAVVNGVSTTLSASKNWGYNDYTLHQLADNEGTINKSWSVRTGAAQNNGLYIASCFNTRDTNGNYIRFEDHSATNENSITVEIEYFTDENGEREYKTVEKKLYID